MTPASVGPMLSPEVPLSSPPVSDEILKTQSHKFRRTSSLCVVPVRLPELSPERLPEIFFGGLSGSSIVANLSMGPKRVVEEPIGLDLDEHFSALVKEYKEHRVLYLGIQSDGILSKVSMVYDFSFAYQLKLLSFVFSRSCRC
nr:hypothetical protein [Tanacetum cinerariifolium]